MVDYSRGESFVEQYKKGKVSEGDIDDFIDTWHEDQDNQSDLAEYLGMTWDEYYYFVKNPNELKSMYIVNK